MSAQVLLDVWCFVEHLRWAKFAREHHLLNAAIAMFLPVRVIAHVVPSPDVTTKLDVVAEDA